jgi:acetoin utilization deacetylase AcuC-like enzyme
VQAVLAGQEVNGFGNKDLQVADSLKYTTGAMYEAAYLALTNKQVACAPVSGFHHAHYTFGGGFCTFNGLMATLYKLRDRGLIQRAAILDLDMHYGDGTEDIIEILGSGSWVKQYSKSFYPRQAETFLTALPSIIEQWADSENRPDIILYQAGADSHVDDPLGGYLTTEQMRRRDRIVFETCKRVGIPVAWNLAGGYQRDADGSIEPVLELHRATMEECAAVFTA